MENTVIIARRRKGRDMWEGYDLVSVLDKKEELMRWREMGRICKAFPSLSAYRADVDRRASA